jgi:hypothetical protein
MELRCWRMVRFSRDLKTEKLRDCVKAQCIELGNHLLLAATNSSHVRDLECCRFWFGMCAVDSRWKRERKPLSMASMLMEPGDDIVIVL